MSTLSRRTVTRGLGAAAGLLALPELGRAQSASPASSPVAGGFTFTDDRDVTVSLPAVPTRVAAMAYAAQSLHDFGYDVHAYYGPNADAEAAGEFAVTGDFDLAALPYLGNYPEYDLEAFIAEETDLIVDFAYILPGDVPPTLWFLADQEAAVADIAPTLGVAMTSISAAESFSHMEALAAALGADVTSDSVAQQKADYEASVAALDAATAEKPDLSVVVLRPYEAGVLVPNYTTFGDFILYADHGVSFIGNDPARAAYDGSWFEYSYEELGLLSADIILTFSEITGNAIYDALPAVQAGQVGVWDSLKRLSYAGGQASVQALVDLFTAADKVV